MVRKVSMASLRKMSHKQLDNRIDRLEAESRKIRHMYRRETEKTKPSEVRIKELMERHKSVSQELKKTYLVYLEKGEALRRKK